MTTPTPTTVGPMVQKLDELAAGARTLLRVAERTGIFFQARIMVPETEVYWPTRIPRRAVATSRGLYDDWVEAWSKRPFIVLGTLGADWSGEPLPQSIATAGLDVANRVAMRALNAPLQVISDGAYDYYHDAKAAKRPISCVRDSDRFKYRADSPEGAQLMVQILLSKPVQHMIHNKDHYSRARSAGEN